MNCNHTKYGCFCIIAHTYCCNSSPSHSVYISNPTYVTAVHKSMAQTSGLKKATAKFTDLKKMSSLKIH